MPFLFRLFLFLTLAVGLSPSTFGREGQVQAELVAEALQVKPGDTLRAGVKFDVADGWHIYGEEPGASGLPTVIEWDLPEGVQASPLHYPPTTPFTFLGEEGDGYEGTVVIWSTIEIPADFEGDLPLRATASWLVCREVCIPGEAELSLRIPTGTESLWSEEKAAFFDSGQQSPEPSAGLKPPVRSLPYYLLLGFLGGLILNIMPCVLPVIGLKILSVVQQSGNDPHLIHKKGWAFTGGVVVSFWLLALVVVLLQGAGKSVGHGFQFQNFPFVVGITSLIFVLALSMLGVFLIDIGSAGYRGAENLTQQRGLAGSFFNGALATVLATPCTAPMLGLALGFAFTQPAWVTFTVFTSIGLGLAFPFTLLAYRPDWLRFLPKPGPWMEYFKQAMGFLMLAVVLWLLWIISYHGAEAVLWMVVFLFALGLACWIFGTFHGPTSKPGTRWTARILILLILFGAWQGILEDRLHWRGEPPSSSRIAWRPFSESNLAEALKTDQPVLVNFTAAWCVSCRANERTSLEVGRTREAIQQTNTIAIKADWTHSDDDITRMLRSFGRAGIPFYLVYGKDRENPMILPEILTPRTVVQALEQAHSSFEE